MKKLVSLLLALVMTLGLVPFGVMADGLDTRSVPAAVEEVSSAACGMADFALTQEGKTGNDYAESDGISFNWCVWFTTYCASKNGLCGTTSDYTSNVFPPVERITWQANNWGATGVPYQINWFTKNSKGDFYYFDSVSSAVSLNDHTIASSRESYVPEVGDLIYFDWELDGAYNHVALVYNYDASTGTVYYIGGNQGEDGTTWATRAVSKVALVKGSSTIVGYLKPYYSAATKTVSSYPPYANVEYGYSSTVACGTIRYISQKTSSDYFYSAYWPASSFGNYSSPGNECGTACISMALSYIGVNKTPNDILVAHNGSTYFSSWGDGVHSAPTVSTGMSNYVNGEGKYSPVVICLKGAGSYNSSTQTYNNHYIMLSGKISDTSYQYVNPASNSLGTTTISGSTATYGSGSYTISQIHQWYNESASLATPTPSPGSTDPTQYTIPTGYLNQGASGEGVKWLQACLCQTGYSTDVDGQFGSGTVSKLKQFQTAYGLTVDGGMGPEVRNKMLELLTCAAPSISSSQYSGGATVTISYSGGTFTSNATVYYSTNGSDPSSTYGGAFNVSSSCTVKAVASMSCRYSSSVSSAYVEVTASGDSTDPTQYEIPTGKLNYGDSGEGVKWLQACLCQCGYTTSVDGQFGLGTKSQLTQFQTDYGLTVDGGMGPEVRGKMLELLTCTAPSISSSQNSNGALVTMSSSGGTFTSGATIYYTTNGSDPTTSSSVYSGQFYVTSSCTAKAIACKSCRYSSSVSSASVTVNTYTVTFVDWNGTVLKTQTVYYSGSATPPSNPSRTGYTFTGWSGTYTNVTANQTVTATYTINTYTVTFKDWDGTVLKTQTVNYGSSATPPADPYRSGYTFTGWSGTYTNITSNQTVTATYAISVCTITFNANGGYCDVSSKTIGIGSAIGALPIPTRDGYDFAGWYPSTSAYSYPINADTTFTEDAVLYAFWSNRQFSGEKISFELNGGAVEGNVTSYPISGFNVPRAADFLVVYNCDGHLIDTNYWGKEVAVNSAGRVIEIRDYLDTHQLTVPVGGFILSGVGAGMDFVDTISYNDYVSYDKSTNTAYCSSTIDAYLKDAKYVLTDNTYCDLPEAVRPGYYFKGWYLNETDDKAVNYLTVYSGSSLVAKWDETPTPVSGTIYNGHKYDLFDYHMTWSEAKEFCEARGGHLVTITDAAEQNAVQELVQEGSYCVYYIGCTDEAEEGSWKWVTGEPFEYTNWDTDAPEPNNSDGCENYGQMLAIDYLVNKQVGEWNDTGEYKNWFHGYLNGGFVCEYETVTITYTGAYVGTEEVAYGGNAVLPVLDVEGAHYVFTVNGEPWDGTNITEDVTVEVGMDIDVYTVDFIDPVTGETLYTQQVEYGDPAAAPEAPAHYGYTFDGWDAEFACVTGDMTVSAIYTPVLFNVYFMDGWSDEVVSEQQVPYLSAAETPADPVREGWIFAGWDADYSCVEYDLVINATWERQYLTVTFTGTYTGTEVVEYGSDCPLPEYNSTSLCYTFKVDGVEWCPENVTEDVTVTVGAALIKNTYHTVTFVGMNGEVIAEVQVKHGEAATAPEAPAVPGYTFVGWDRENFDCVTYSMTRTAVYEESQIVYHTVTFVDWDGTVLSVQQVEDGADAVAPERPSRADYSFIGWDVDYTNVTEDLVVTALYEPNQHYDTVGDADGNGVLSFSDVAALYNMILSGGGLTAEQEYVCDVNGDGAVSFADVAALYNVVLGAGA